MATKSFSIRIDETMLDKLHVPNILLGFRLRRNDLAAVNNRAASHSQNAIYLLFSCQRCALLHFCISRVGHNAGEIHNSLSLLAQDGYNFIIDPIFLYRTAAVGQHDGVACVQLCVQCLLGGALSKRDVSGMFISKIFHGIFAPSPLVVEF